MRRFFQYFFLVLKQTSILCVYCLYFWKYANLVCYLIFLLLTSPQNSCNNRSWQLSDFFPSDNMFCNFSENLKISASATSKWVSQRILFQLVKMSSNQVFFEKFLGILTCILAGAIVCPESSIRAPQKNYKTYILYIFWLKKQKTAPGGSTVVLRKCSLCQVFLVIIFQVLAQYYGIFPIILSQDSSVMLAIFF